MFHVNKATSTWPLILIRRCSCCRRIRVIQYKDAVLPNLYSKPHFGDKTILRPSCFHIGIAYSNSDTITSLYWSKVPGPQFNIKMIWDFLYWVHLYIESGPRFRFTNKIPSYQYIYNDSHCWDKTALLVFQCWYPDSSRHQEVCQPHLNVEKDKKCKT